MFHSRHRPTLPGRLRQFVWPQMGWKRWIRYTGHRIGRLPASPHAIAVGFAAGASVSMTPLIGAHILIGLGLAWLCRGSLVAAALGTLVGNPWTFPIIWFFSYRLGHVLMGAEPGAEPGAALTGSGIALSLLLQDPWAFLLPMLFGGGLMALASWPLFYLAVRWPVALYRNRRRSGRVRSQKMREVVI
jgi:uncharacterized protein